MNTMIPWPIMFHGKLYPFMIMDGAYQALITFLYTPFRSSSSGLSKSTAAAGTGPTDTTASSRGWTTAATNSRDSWLNQSNRTNVAMFSHHAHAEGAASNSLSIS